MPLHCKDEILKILYDMLENTPIDRHNDFTFEWSTYTRANLIKVISLIEATCSNEDEAIRQCMEENCINVAKICESIKNEMED